VGRSPYLQAVNVQAAPETMGQVVAVTITRAGPNSLHGDLIQAPGTHALDARKKGALAS